MNVHLIDGTYELFRHYFGAPPAQSADGQEVGAVRGVLVSVLAMIESGATHLGVATDHVIESFRNDLYPGYKTAEGVAPDLLAQFQILEEALAAMGVLVWPMTHYEADDALASAAHKSAADPAVERVFICTPDKDLAQCVSGTRVIQFDRRRNILRDESGVMEKWGVRPVSIPDWLALVGDSADGYPGLPGWGPKAASTVFAQFPHFEDVPRDHRRWPPSLRGAQRLATVLFDNWSDAQLYRDLATLRLDVPVFDTIEALRWRGPTPEFAACCDRLAIPTLSPRAMAAGAR